MQGIGSPKARQAKPWVRGPDLLTVLRIPLALIFLFNDSAAVRLGVVLAGAASDVLDGMWARRIGGSRIGVVLDPVCDKAFMATTFGVVLVSGGLSWYEGAGVLLRDIVAVVAFLVVSILHRPTTLPARAGGKAVTVGQLLTLLAFLAGSDLLRPLAWATAAISVYAIADYTRAAQRR